MKKIFFLILILFLLILGVFFLKPTPRIIIKEELITTVNNQAISFSIEIKKLFRNIEADNLELQVSHKYNKSINQKYTINPYNKGKYYFYYDPLDHGEYTFTFHFVINNNNIIKTKVITFDAI